MEFKLLDFRWGMRQFSLFEVATFYGTADISICQIQRFDSDGSGEWVRSVWPLLRVCFFSRHNIVWADVYLFGNQFTIRRQGRSGRDDLLF